MVFKKDFEKTSKREHKIFNLNYLLINIYKIINPGNPNSEELHKTVKLNDLRINWQVLGSRDFRILRVGFFGIFEMGVKNNPISKPILF